MRFRVGTCKSAVCVRIESRTESAVGPRRGTARRTTAVYRSAFVSGGAVEAANDVLVDGATENAGLENAGPENAGLNVFYFCR